MTNKNQIAFETIASLINRMKGGPKVFAIPLAAEMVKDHAEREFNLDFLGFVGLAGERMLFVSTLDHLKLKVKVLPGDRVLLIKLSPKGDFRGACFSMERDAIALTQVFPDGGIIRFSDQGSQYELFFNKDRMQSVVKDFQDFAEKYFEGPH